MNKDFFDGNKRIYLYGAQSVAYTVYKALNVVNNDLDIVSFVVSERNNNPYFIEGIPVLTIDELVMQEDTELWIATPDNTHASIIQVLKDHNIRSYCLIDSYAFEYLSRKYYEVTTTKFILQNLPAEEKKTDTLVLMAKCERDFELVTNYQCPSWVAPIQVGAALTEQKLSECRDDIGDNISAKNRNYSELTATYWAAKHAISDYIGIYHYRRVLNITEEDLYRIKENDIDVILPYPILLYPNIETNHKRAIREEDWKATLDALEMCAPEYARALPDICKGQEFFHFNMLVAKREVFIAYANWLFPILECIEKISIPPAVERNDRYLGYIGENLTNLYFTYHRKDLKIAYTGRYILT